MDDMDTATVEWRRAGLDELFLGVARSALAALLRDLVVERLGGTE